MKMCSEDGCDSKCLARGLCSTHYAQLRRAGGVKPRQSFSERFWAKVEKRGPEDCWLWLASTSVHGYGRFGDRRLDCGWTTAHRASYEINVGTIPEGQVVRHRCHNRSCVNPSHLQLGSHRDNSRDTAEAGRITGQKLSDQDVLDIRLACKQGATYRGLAREYEVTPRTIKLAATGATFRHLPMDSHPCPTCGRDWD